MFQQCQRVSDFNMSAFHGILFGGQEDGGPLGEGVMVSSHFTMSEDCPIRDGKLIKVLRFGDRSNQHHIALTVSFDFVHR